MPQNPWLVFVARGLTKTYQMGEVTVQALRGIDLEIYEERTFGILLAAGFTAHDIYRCSKAAGLLFADGSRDCEALFQMITSWRDAIIKSAVPKKTPPN